jgi:hypothetical protein
MSRVIKQNTLALVMEVEASVSEAEDGHASRSIVLPQDLMEIVEKGRQLEWDHEIDIKQVCLFFCVLIWPGTHVRSLLNCSRGWLSWIISMML